MLRPVRGAMQDPNARRGHRTAARHAGEAVRRVAGEGRRPLVLGCRPRGETDPCEAKPCPEERCGSDREAGEVEPILRDREPCDLDASVREEEATTRCSLPNSSVAIAWIVNITPTEATTLASVGAARSGRKTTRCAARPTSAEDTMPSASAAEKGTLSPRCRRCGTPTSGKTRSPLARSSLYTYVPHMAIAPWAKFTIPVPL